MAAAKSGLCFTRAEIQCAPMETYLLITAVAIFMGVMCLVWLADKRRRANLEQFSQVSQVLGESSKTLQEIHATNYSQLNELKGSVENLQKAVLELQKTVSDSGRSSETAAELLNDALRNDVRKSFEKLSSALLTATGAISKTNHELKTELVEGLKSVSDVIAMTNRGLTTAVLKEVADAAKQIEQLRKSLEESIKF
jgi:hypothetical protein